ncbi:MAG: hypothetical protein KC466_18535 [Myxococcales bacterium]|nr:hypothetical protein [Myxococcales bacterium]
MAKSSIELTVLANSDDLSQALHHLWKCSNDIYMAYAWISSARGDAAHWKGNDLSKIRQAVIGTHFDQTEPKAIELLAKRPGPLKIVDSGGPVFHPKVIVGLSGEKARAIIGSSNFTTGGFGVNTELNLLLNASKLDPIVEALLSFIDDQWERGESFCRVWLDDYEERYEKRPKPARRGSDRVSRTKRGRRPKLDEINLTWDEYEEFLWAANERDSGVLIGPSEENSHLAELERCRPYFDEYSSFSAIPKDGQRLIAGLKNSGSHGCFGTGYGNGSFVQLVENKPERIGDFIDRIPRTGNVEPSLVEECLNGLASIRAEHRVLLGTAGRLLVVKRPDLFMPVNTANRNGIKKLFGFAPASSSVDYSKVVGEYVSLHERIWCLPWFSSPRPPRKPSNLIHDARVALLDIAVYDPPPSKG